ncbi:Anthocyanidin 5,3-O-glucosyltransferase [Apostasia shenzhenica]|uniref:Anthocyanidin 5,3-O-glucosyltransferase n=1 Tax=Apostasia shenzhenica TaxID=1088818 RepID=A0A2I0BFP7_9ASPA|nr:Anthocyanidin 5,3-O-glucosyltransferase [Apostasia shenzhenica]
MEKDAVVLYPIAFMGHLTPMVELGKLLLRHGFSVTVVLHHCPFPDNNSVDSYVAAVAASHPSISFHRLPPVSLPSFFSDAMVASFELIRLSNPHLVHYLQSSSSVRAIILDVYSADAMDAAAQLCLPSFFFNPTSASSFVAFLYLPTLLTKSAASFKELGDHPIAFPGLPRPIIASDMPLPIHDRATAYRMALDQFGRVPLSKGILVNSFDALERPALRALAAGDCVPDKPMPPVYFVGPITAGVANEDQRHESLAWLDGQPSASVVFLCFGSIAAFPPQQLREIADGLERSGQRFLWVARCSSVAGKEESAALPATEPDLLALMPEGFMERTKGRGLVVKSWAPQVAVLGHKAVGGFVTHCGWNSVLEAILAGVGMIAWPLYAEQRMNRAFLVEEVGLAVEMRRNAEGMAAAAEVEEKVRWLMESEEGRELRARAADIGESARAALREGGSSHTALIEVASLLRGATIRE